MLLEVVVETPFVEILDEVTLKPAILELVETDEDKAVEEAEVEEAEADEVVPEPLTTTEPVAIEKKVIRSTYEVSSPMEVNKNVMISSITRRT